MREGPFQEIWIQPAAGDAGGALGTAMFIWHQILDNQRTPCPSDSQQGSMLGPSFTEEEIRKALDGLGAKYRRYESEEELCRHVAELIAANKVVGWVQGRMEFGLGRLAGGASWAMPAAQKCRP